MWEGYSRLTLLLIISRGFLPERLSLISCELFSWILYTTARRFLFSQSFPRPIAQRRIFTNVLKYNKYMGQWTAYWKPIITIFKTFLSSCSCWNYILILRIFTEMLLFEFFYCPPLTVCGISTRIEFLLNLSNGESYYYYCENVCFLLSIFISCWKKPLTR